MELRLNRNLYRRSAIDKALADFGLKRKIVETGSHYSVSVPDAKEFANYVLGTMRNDVQA
jgi:hypothetical protein